ncbi:MAG: CZB domain-containing protein [Gallionella sp.]|nr:CZB domain-containing protein [Gallionella sp.]
MQTASIAQDVARKYEAADFDSYGKRGLRDRLNIIAAAEAHVVWKNRLGNHVRGVSHEPLGAALLGQDGICQLGRLINGTALAVFHEKEVYRQLRVAHEQFHQLALVVVDKLKAGDHTGAAALFENEYSHALHDILQSLSQINRLLLE